MAAQVRDLEDKTDHYEDVISTYLERVSDHCSNIAGCVIEADLQDIDIHRSLKAMKLDSQYYRETYNAYSEKYLKKNEIE